MTVAPLSDLDRMAWAACLAEFTPTPPPAQKWATPGEMAKALDGNTVQTPALDLIDEALVDVAEGRCKRLMISLPPQEGKSVRISRRFPEWLLSRDPSQRIAIVSYAHGVARRHGRSIRDDIGLFPAEFGVSVNPSSSAAHEWELNGHQGGVYCVGVTGSLTSRPVDCLRGDMLVDTDCGPIPIRDLCNMPGSKPRVLTYSHELERTQWQPIEATRAVDNRPLIEVTTTARRIVVCTPDHLIHAAGGYIPAGELKVGQQLLATTGVDAVASVRALDERATVYDIQVGGNHNFYAQGVLVHNCMIIDDPYKNGEQADSLAWQETVQDFWSEVAIPRLGPGAVVIIVQTRWRADDLSGWLQTHDEAGLWRVINIPAQADHDPNKGETDPLGRQPGEYLESARGRTPEEWDQRKREMGSRAWNALCQGRPAPAQGNIFDRDWWQYYSTRPWRRNESGAMYTIGFDQVLQSWDMAFKDTDSSDYVVGQVWGRRGSSVYLLDQVRDRLSFVDTCHAVRALSAKWPDATLKLVEDKANGTAVINALRNTVPGLVPVQPNGSKTARAAAVSPFVEARSVYLPAPEIAPWVSELVEEATSFPLGAHDDQIDAMSQAINRLMLNHNDRTTPTTGVALNDPLGSRAFGSGASVDFMNMPM